MAQKRHEVEIGQEHGPRHTNGKAEYLDQDFTKVLQIYLHPPTLFESTYQDTQMVS